MHKKQQNKMYTKYEEQIRTHKLYNDRIQKAMTHTV